MLLIVGRAHTWRRIFIKCESYWVSNAIPASGLLEKLSDTAADAAAIFLTKRALAFRNLEIRGHAILCHLFLVWRGWRSLHCSLRAHGRRLIHVGDVNLLLVLTGDAGPGLSGTGGPTRLTKLYESVWLA